MFCRDLQTSRLLRLSRIAPSVATLQQAALQRDQR